MKKIIFALTMVLSAPALSHEGEHDAPGTVQAPKGGMIKSLETIHIEVLTKKNELEIHPYTKDLKPLELSKVGVKASVTLPRSKKMESLPLTPKGNFWQASYDAKGAHRYTLTLNLKPADTGHDDKLSFTIEPKK